MIVKFTAFYNGTEYSAKTSVFYHTDPQGTSHDEAYNTSVTKFHELLHRCVLEETRINNSWFRVLSCRSSDNIDFRLTYEELLDRTVETFISTMIIQLSRDQDLRYEKVRFDFACNKLDFVITGIE